VSKLSAKVF